MAVRILKGQEIDITKNNPGLKKINIALGWEINKKEKNQYDFDSSVFLCNKDGIALSSRHFVFYNNKQDPFGAVVHLGDNKTGEEGEEEIVIYLEKIPSEVWKLVFSVSIHEGERKKQNFGQVQSSYLKIMDGEKNEELVRFDLKNEFSLETGIIIGEMYKVNDEWKFKTDGTGFPEGLRGIVIHHGLL